MAIMPLTWTLRRNCLQDDITGASRHTRHQGGNTDIWINATWCCYNSAQELVNNLPDVNFRIAQEDLKNPESGGGDLKNPEFRINPELFNPCDVLASQNFERIIRSKDAQEYRKSKFLSTLPNSPWVVKERAGRSTLCHKIPSLPVITGD